ncbi:MAG TPA: sugar phosphate isomerase/epimerase [Steroidobacteraceae bacterium]|nr:sugar phosphate isomerase/epimerase [Steroidobacteraceae bacterium]
MLPNDVLSIQLWSTRGATSLAEQLAFLRHCGYGDVQPYHDQCDDPKEFRALLDEFGLTARSGHFTLAMFETALDHVVRTAHTTGMRLVVAPWLDPDERPKDEDGWKVLGRKLSGLSRQLAQEGLRFAWHNHEFEFEALPDGSYGIEHALGENVLLELDLGWLFKCGQDPLLWLKRYAGRLPAVHVKDVAAPGANPEEMNFADVGAGVMDLPLYWRAAVEAGAELMVAEHDAPSDWRRFARASAMAMRRLAGVERTGLLFRTFS